MLGEAYQHDICIVGGAGHVGLPLAILFATKGQRVVLYDINETALEKIRQGIVPFMEKGAEPLLRQALMDGTLAISSDIASTGAAAVIVITIGTPVDEFMNPVFKGIRRCVEDMLPYLHDDQLIVLRSTVFPGTTDWLAKYLRDKGLSSRIAFCPERVVQGLAIEELQLLPQIVSGTTPEAEEEAARLFGVLAPELVSLKPIEAEFAKLFNNAYRYIEFAIANQFYMITSAAGVDYYRVLEGMKRNYPRARGIPRAGFAAGPCLYKDTVQLIAFAANNFSLGNAAILINEGMVLYIIEQIKARYDLEHLTVGLLGMAFKANVDDIRASLSYKLKKALSLHAARVLTTDPHVTTDPDPLPLDAVLAESDLLILCVPHHAYKALETYGKPVIDIWGYLEQTAPNTTQVLVG
jgi:UDP-N-acetyl-D-mannosaminuronic acid dehydrogenase